MARNMMGELGRLGTNRYGGYLREEFLPELQGKRGIETYKEMAENDDVIGAILFAMEMLLRQVVFQVEPAGVEDVDTKAAEFVSSCLDDMEHSWTDFISECLSFLTYGWSYHEIVYKRRMGPKKNPQLNSKYEDGLIGWRKLPLRSQDSLYEWAYEGDSDVLRGMVQSCMPDYATVLIPKEKALHFRTKSKKGNPEGRSLLRNAYRAWYYKKHLQELEAIGIERDLAGLPVLIAPEGMSIFSEEYEEEYLRAEALVKSVRRDQQGGIVLPGGWSFTLASSSGTSHVDVSKVIERYDNRMAMTVLADFILLGHEGVGSFALSSDKTALFSVALGTFLDVITETFTKEAIIPLIDLNKSAFPGLRDYPRLVHSDIETQNLGELGTFVKEMVGIGVLTPDESMESYLRRTADLPEKDMESDDFDDFFSRKQEHSLNTEFSNPSEEKFEAEDDLEEFRE